jgi:hypothetical protein
MWRIADKQVQPMARDEWGTFHSGDSYVVLYKYRNARGRDESIVYFWLGSQ